MRRVSLTDQVEGINLKRFKGGAAPSSLFDLLNGWITPKGTIQARPGYVLYATLPTTGAGPTFGQVGFDGKIHVFSSNGGGIFPTYVINWLLHPTGSALTAVYNAFPFLGRLYVVAGFANGDTIHYWLENSAAWTANTALAFGDRRQPTSQNGYYYEVATANTSPAWTPNTVVVNGDVKQPTTYNGFKYTAGSLTGTAPFRTSNTEPTWPTVDGATVVERRYITEPQIPPGDDTPPDPTPGGAPDDYGPYPPIGDEGIITDEE